MGWGHGDWGWGAWLAMSLGMVAFWALVVWAIVTLTRNAARSSTASPRTPREILAERLATGEIDEDEYRRRLEALESSGPGASGRR